MSENITESYQNYVKPQLGQLLRILRLDKNFQSASGDQMTYVASEQTRTVYDFLGGYGSAILGHNPRFLLDEIDQFFKNKRVIQAQASLRSESALLAQLIHTQVSAELKTTDTFISTFASTGTEATEIALKNAMLIWQHKKDLLKKNLLSLVQSSYTDEEQHQVYQALANEIDGTVPVLISLTRSYHGKTASAVLSSSSDYYKKMYSSLLFKTIFLDPEADWEYTLASLRKTVKVIEFKQKEFSFSPFIGFIFEPIQGEGGIRPVALEKLTKAFKFAAHVKIPTIADEIQSGLYRTGRLLVSADLGLQPDMILLGKSLGGGVAKISAMVCRSQSYVRELGMIHSSTFAEDDYSSRLAIATLQHLEANKLDLRKRADEFESDIKLFFKNLSNKYPKWIKDVRGKGFFLGIEFNFLENEHVPTLLYSLAINGHASYLLTSYLLNRHQIRVGVTLSSPETLRIEPPAYISAAAVTQLKLAFEELLETLETYSLGNLFSHIFSKDEIIPNRPPLLQKPFLSKSPEIKDVAFLGHIINWDHAQRLDPSLRDVKTDRLKKFFTSYAEFSKPFRYHQQIIESADGQKIRLNLYGLTVVSDFFETDIRRPMPIMVDTLQEFVDELKLERIDYLGLGQFTSIVTRNGTLLDSKGMAITTGNSLTTGFAIEAMETFVHTRQLRFEHLNIGIVGFGGNIGRAVTQILAGYGSNLTLVYKEAFDTSSRFQAAVDDVVTTSGIDKSKLHPTADFNDLKRCDIIVLGTNSTQELLQPEHMKRGCLVVDISVPSNVSRVVRSSKDYVYVSAGRAKLPNSQKIDHSWLPLLSGDCFACLAETIVLGLSHFESSYSLGDLSIERVELIRQLAKARGFTLNRGIL
jgi:acetylornithine/succinyldiaminopimelate/putrescine aminotransferase/predicted amino acid dehydrogenase